MLEKSQKCEAEVQELLHSSEIARVLGRLHHPYLIIDLTDGSILNANPGSHEMLGLEADDLSGSLLDELSPAGFPRLDFFTRPRDYDLVIHRFSYQAGDRAKEIRLSGSCIACSDRKIFAAQLEDLSSRAAFGSYLIEHGHSRGTVPVDSRELLEFSLGLCHTLLPLSAAAAFFPDFCPDIVLLPRDADNAIADLLQQVISTRGPSDADFEGEIDILPLADSEARIIHIAVSPGDGQRGSIALYLPAQAHLRQSALPSLQYVAQLTAEQLMHNQAKGAIQLKSLSLKDFERNTRLSLAILDGEEVIQDCSAMLSEMLGMDRELIIGRRLVELRNIIPIPAEQEAGRAFPVMYSYLRPDQTPVYFNATSAMLEDGRSLLLLWNVTAVRRLEDDLILAQNQTKAAQQSKGDFISNISHELRTPLNGINGMAQLLEETDLDEEQLDMVETLRHSVDNLNNLIQDLLDFSRLDTGKIIIEEDYFPVHRVISQVISNNRTDAEAKGLRILLDAEDSGLHYFSDAMRFQQIINNLLANAVKFTDSGEIRLNYALGDSTLDVSVRDSGIGIPIKMQRRIFDSFTQLEHTYTKYRQGLGLGLAICKRLSLLMGGELTLESEPGIGSTFTLTLPVKPGMIDFRQQEGSGRRRAGERTVDRFAGLRVLVAEDDFLNRKTLVRFLKMQGCMVSAAQNGLEAEHLLRTMDFDLLIFDITMPELSGQELTHLVRQKKIHSQADVPILGVTAHVFPDEIQSFLDSGMNEVLTKPFVPSQLYDHMEAILSKS
jgi:signal transduction histidine kinase